MKNLLLYTLACLVILSSFSMNAQDRDPVSRELAGKTKSNLVDALKTTADQFDFGIDAQSVQSSRAASSMAYLEADFDRLLRTDAERLAEILDGEMKRIVPYVNSGRVVATVAVAKNENGQYEVTELINHQYRKELNELPGDIREQGFRNVRIVVVPNLNATIYHMDGKNYTKYKGRSLRSAVEDAALLRVLQADARAFQSKYGDMIKENELLR